MLSGQPQDLSCGSVALSRDCGSLEEAICGFCEMGDDDWEVADGSTHCRSACRCHIGGEAEVDGVPIWVLDLDLRDGVAKDWPGDEDDDDEDDDVPPPPLCFGVDGWPLPPAELATTTGASSTAAGSTGASISASPDMAPAAWAPARHFASYDAWPTAPKATSTVIGTASTPDGFPEALHAEGSRVVRPPADEARLAETLNRATAVAAVANDDVRWMALLAGDGLAWASGELGGLASTASRGWADGGQRDVARSPYDSNMRTYSEHREIRENIPYNYFQKGVSSEASFEKHVHTHTHTGLPQLISTRDNKQARHQKVCHRGPIPPPLVAEGIPMPALKCRW